MKDFIKLHSGKYPNLFVEYVGGDPRIQFFEKGGEPLGKEVDISRFESEAIHGILESKGITMADDHSLESKLPEPEDPRYEHHVDL